jgi:uncharacterized protein YkwD
MRDALPLGSLGNPGRRRRGVTLAGMRNIVRATAVAACLSALVPATAAANSSPASADRAAARPATVLRLVNAERTSRGLPRLRSQPALRAAARGYALQMVRQKFFSHDRAGLIRRIRRTGYLRRYPHWALGENIAWGTRSSGRPKAIVQAWMASPPHRRNILNPRFRRIGIGIAPGAPVAGATGATYVTDFGMRRR